MLFLGAIVCPAYAANNFSADVSPVIKETTIVAASQEFPVGEKLAYEVSWIGVPVGVGTLEVKGIEEAGGRKAYHVVAVAQTNEFLSKIYPVRDEMHSWVDAETLQSLKFQKTASEGFYHADEVTHFDAANKKGHYESLKSGQKKEFDIHVPVHDVISAFFWVRRQALEPGHSVKTVVNNGEKDYDLEVQTLRHEMKEMRGQGTADLLLIEPKTRLKGILEKRGRVWIHLENSSRRIPILITFKTPFGPIVGILKRSR